jgi:hypothetical protein
MPGIVLQSLIRHIAPRRRNMHYGITMDTTTSNSVVNIATDSVYFINKIYIVTYSNENVHLWISDKGRWNEVVIYGWTIHDYHELNTDLH